MVVKITSLPDESILYILTFITYKDLVRCSSVCHRFSSLSNDDILWRRHAKFHFLLQDHLSSWKEAFIIMYKIFKDEIEVYPAIRYAWNQIENYLSENMPDQLECLRDPVEHDDLVSAERKMKMPFPPDLRCSLKIHDGQIDGPGPGLFGLVILSEYLISEKLLDCQSIADTYEDSPGELDGTVRLTLCYSSDMSHYLALSDCSGFVKNQIFYPCSSGRNTDKMDHFIQANSFSDWFCKFAADLEKEIYPKVMDGMPLLFNFDPECVAITDDIFTVKVGTHFMPDMSRVNPPMFLFGYRISMSMKADANPHRSCQLETRHWIITDEDGVEERVDGPGVVGEYPIMKPGKEFSWTSCTTLKTTYGNMKGHFTMANIHTGESIQIECPCFHMKCMPYETSDQRKERRLLAKKQL